MQQPQQQALPTHSRDDDAARQRARRWLRRLLASGERSESAAATHRRQGKDKGNGKGDAR